MFFEKYFSRNAFSSRKKCSEKKKKIKMKNYFSGNIFREIFFEKYFSKNIFRKISFGKSFSINMFRKIFFEKYFSKNKFLGMYFFRYVLGVTITKMDGYENDGSWNAKESL